jgi:glycosyltransferase involved in cell wall biosynthesis
MRIGVDARLMHHQKAGISKYTWHLLQAFAQLNLDDEFILFQHRKQSEPVVQATNFRRATLFAPVHTRLEQYMVPVELARFQLSLLHSTDFIPPIYARVPTVITVHDLAFLHYPHFMTARSAAYYGQIDRAVRAAEAVIVPSEHTRQDLVAMLGVSTAKINVIYEAAAEMFAPMPADEARAVVAREYGITAPYLLFVGTLEPRKNISGLLQAFHHLRTRYGASDPAVADTLLVIAGGKGWLSDELDETVQRLGLASHVRFLGRVSDALLPRLYAAARAHVHPAHYEGFGLPPLEAMASGTPTIVSNVSSLPEVVSDAALLADPNNPEEIAVAMHRLLSDDALHAEMREKGLARARCFSWQRAATATLDVARRVAEARPATASRLVSSTEKP